MTGLEKKKQNKFFSFFLFFIKNFVRFIVKHAHTHLHRGIQHKAIFKCSTKWTRNKKKKYYFSIVLLPSSRVIFTLKQPSLVHFQGQRRRSSILVRICHPLYDECARVSHVKYSEVQIMLRYSFPIFIYVYIAYI